MSGYIGNIPTPQATQSRQNFTATAGQTSFATVGYTPNFLDVYLNGSHLLNGTDYAATNGSDVVLTVGATLADVVEVISYTTFQVLNESFAGTTTVVDLSVTGDLTAVGMDATDLTLSGSLFLGGTGAANQLDDYEEGTWIPVFSDAASGGNTDEPTSGKRGFYTKIGRQVTVSMDAGDIRTVGMTPGSDFYIQGLPFAPISVSSPNGFYPGAVRASNITFTGYLTAFLIDNTTYFRLLECISGSASDNVRVTEVADNAADLNATITYFTSS
tara:strand:+ start:4060 stop:4875 length:816 start_codon:yes stop_codon:yes gene_type:complete